MPANHISDPHAECPKSPSGAHEFGTLPPVVGVCIWCHKAQSYEVAFKRAEETCRPYTSLKLKEDCMRDNMKALGYELKITPLKTSEHILATSPMPEAVIPPHKRLPAYGLPEKPYTRENAIEYIARQQQNKAEWMVIDGVWQILRMDKTTNVNVKNYLWQDYVAAWNRRGILTNDQAELLLEARLKP